MIKILTRGNKRRVYETISRVNENVCPRNSNSHTLQWCVRVEGAQSNQWCGRIELILFGMRMYALRVATMQI